MEEESNSKRKLKRLLEEVLHVAVLVVLVTLGCIEVY